MDIDEGGRIWTEAVDALVKAAPQKLPIGTEENKDRLI
jgi:hypothetical protein